ncbi:hypothetical protein B7767_27670 [Streptomyces sp. 13-12-16]|nr:hypothetical protein B7767_27670 [Streptomyces sp. 13-12-16]
MVGDGHGRTRVLLVSLCATVAVALPGCAPPADRQPALRTPADPGEPRDPTCAEQVAVERGESSANVLDVALCPV